ncbi:hypothetical protein I307_05834 [Cryptococcus deuterogattii 99/473]|uniref:Low temperature requirement protein A n=1 Tax=Cryptococcus deuterogattii Ram5 TaxID=1296110 RepID=A0A0D0UU66_9TREE|nr:hypothetical protein I309_06297 [Cryptococcus deuterogattii LA55]KIR37619.1 hypothetical protein I313_06342 [Cryptococcus deuterogattii Ram5]KIR70233.1 hypothetical protein I310_05859 [Cryptococcus deuterogattii CA1014]KIR89881.1 hypothetical protein I304_06401 [Cryptococcus deuterogattii CBS 10090]KIR96683.1 hypothetical protein L804_06169 [Cryptococcus deuterogattii 2001/935-1]KIY54852.1 hypothetical protein I307_05834 [Cryptococcus deuterogattii 99/473]
MTEHRPSSPSTSTSQRNQSAKGLKRRGTYGTENHLVFHEDFQEEWKPLKIRELIRPLTVRQWIEGGKIHREPVSRETPRFELFFDLFWSVWEEARKFANQSGTDDLLHRLWILIGMMTLIGYTANASAIELEPTGEEEIVDHSAVRAAVAFWLVIKLTRVIVLLYYAWKLPSFRGAHIWKAIAVLIPMFFLLPLIWVTSRTAQIVLATLLIVVDVCRIDLLELAIRGRIYEFQQRRAEGKKGLDMKGWHRMPDLPQGYKIPVMNIEHAVERLGAFVVIVLGEMVMNLVYTATKGEIGVSHQFGKAALGLMVAWAINYLEPNADYEHALRHSWFSGVCFTFFHWPLCAALVLASAASGKMVANDEVDSGVHWYWGSGVGFAIIFMAILDLTHHNLAPGQARIARVIRALLALCAGLSLILFSLGTEHMSSTAVLAITVGITWFLLAFDIVGMLPKPGTVQKEELERREREEEQGKGVVVQDMDGRGRLERVDGVGEVREERIEEGRLEEGNRS